MDLIEFPFQHKTTFHCAERKASFLITGLCSSWIFKFCSVNCIVSVYETKSFEVIQFFSHIQYWAIERTRQLTDQEGNFRLCKIVFHDNNQESESWLWYGQTCYGLLNVFLSQLFVNLFTIFGCFWRIHPSKTCDESIVRVGTMCVASGYISPSPRLRRTLFQQQNRVVILLVGPSETRKSTLIYNWLKIEPFKHILIKFTFSVDSRSHFTTLYNEKLVISNLFKV